MRQQGLLHVQDAFDGCAHRFRMRCMTLMCFYHQIQKLIDFGTLMAYQQYVDGRVQALPDNIDRCIVFGNGAHIEIVCQHQARVPHFKTQKVMGDAGG